MLDPSTVWRVLTSAERFTAALFSEGIDTGVSIEYTQPDRMLIRNLQGELPPHLFLEGQTASFSGTLASDLADWETLPHESGFLAYRMLDPRVVLDYAELVEVKSLDDGVEEGTFQMALKELLRAGLPESLVEALIQQNNGQDLMEVVLRVHEESLPTEMALFDFPPEPTQVTLRFLYPATM